MLKRVRKTIEKHHMLQPGDRVLVAVSGGPDSVCLLSVLAALSVEYRLTLHVAHLDHRFRGKGSADDAIFVERTAAQFNVPATIEQFDVPRFCAERGLTAQAGAREARYGFLRRVAGAVGASRIALGHTATDQAETLIMRLIRGAGMAGLSAIPPIRETIIRPLIEVTREEVTAYLRENDHTFINDPSNTKPLYTRNRIRMDLMPRLSTYNPQIVRTLSMETNILRDEDALLEQQVAAIAPRVISEEQDIITLNRTAFAALEPALRRRVLRKAVDLFGADPAELSFLHSEGALSFIADARTGKTMHLPSGLVMEREYDRILLRSASAVRAFSIELNVPGITVIPDLALEVETSIRREQLDHRDDPNYLWQAWFDYDKIASPLFIRSRNNGDRFCPAGMAGKSKKLQDYFVDEKVPRRRRDTVPILASKSGVVWIVGMRTDERFLPALETQRRIMIGIRPVMQYPAEQK